MARGEESACSSFSLCVWESANAEIHDQNKAIGGGSTRVLVITPGAKWNHF